MKNLKNQVIIKKKSIVTSEVLRVFFEIKMENNTETDVDIVEITLNWQGEDYMIQVDLQTANTLLNDPDEADIFMRRMMSFQGTPAETSLGMTSCAKSTTYNVWFGKGRPTTACHEATIKLLELRLHYNKQFIDKKSNRDALWNLIVEQLIKSGFNVDLKKVKQKFANLQKSYIKYKDHVMTTGTEKLNPPPYYRELDAILGDKHKCSPQAIEDTEEIAVPGCSGTNIKIHPNDKKIKAPEEIKNRFSKVKKEIRPKTANQQYINFLKTHLEEEAAERRQQFQDLKDILNTQTQQREKMLDLWKTSLTRKRRHNSSSDED